MYMMCSLFPLDRRFQLPVRTPKVFFRRRYSFQDLLGPACHVDEKESWGFLCVPLISLTDAGSANQIQL